MQRWIGLGVAFLLMVGAATFAWQRAASTQAGGAGPVTSVQAPPAPSAEVVALPVVPAGVEVPSLQPTPTAPEAVLGDSAPREVRFGVVLLQYRGAEGASGTARSKAAAETLARELATAAKTDFSAAVARGDAGSVADAGRIPRGVLEQSVEVALFSLKPGETAGPVDTPRGFWIVRRME